MSISKLDGIAHPVTQVTSKLPATGILDLSKVYWTFLGCFYTNSGPGLRMEKELDPYSTGNE